MSIGTTERSNPVMASDVLPGDLKQHMGVCMNIPLLFCRLFAIHS
ncbi:MAG: hypothetical protein OEZ57_13060 [Nitrospirota bacterium]|nr:hypothetical protein [Nitrospirota bacterium]MDH5585433.1 hypothetical protein [Nitrospirota bacterium]MDH5775829.1 hypothetical protein [Nitrospirota bacterium]